MGGTTPVGSTQPAPAGASAGTGAGPWTRRVAVAFGRFWWEFLIGETPELFLATLVLIGLAVLLHRHTGIAVVVLLVAAVVFLVGSTWRGRSKPRDG
jgi:hypothetical protein